jgi:hypothetical protein
MEETPERPVSSIVPVPPAPQSLDEPAAPAKADLVVEAEWVRRFPSRRHRNLYAWLALALKVVAAFGLAWLFIILPAGSLPTPLQTWKNPVIICALVCFIGKTLLDTFFYDHYQP